MLNDDVGKYLVEVGVGLLHWRFRGRLGIPSPGQGRVCLNSIPGVFMARVSRLLVALGGGIPNFWSDHTAPSTDTASRSTSPRHAPRTGARDLDGPMLSHRECNCDGNLNSSLLLVDVFEGCTRSPDTKDRDYFIVLVTADLLPDLVQSEHAQYVRHQVTSKDFVHV